MRVEKFFAVHKPSGLTLIQKLRNPTFQSFKYIQIRVKTLTDSFQEVPGASSLVHLHDFELHESTS